MNLVMQGPLTRHQPFKGLYIAYLIITVPFIRVPWWCLRFLPRSNRPRASWTLSRCVLVTFYREVLTKLATDLGLKASHAPPKSDDKLEDAAFLWIEGISVESEAFRGEVRRAADITGVRPAKVPVYWLYKAGETPPEGSKARDGERVVLHIHGGAFHLGSAHPDAPTVNLSRGILAHSRSISRILAVEYRLSAAPPDEPANPFPAAVLDCVAAYQYLINDLGFLPQNITIAGDSAGANIALAVTRHLVESALPSLPPPGRLVSCSAWLDLSESHHGPESSLSRNRKSDILGMGPTYPRAAYLGSLGMEEAKTNRYISPVSPHFAQTEGLFRGFPRTYVSAGGAEVILDDSMLVVEKMRADGIDVVVKVFPDAIHDFTTFTWHEPERTEALKLISSWLDE